MIPSGTRPNTVVVAQDLDTNEIRVVGFDGSGRADELARHLNECPQLASRYMYWGSDSSTRYFAHQLLNRLE